MTSDDPDLMPLVARVNQSIELPCGAVLANRLAKAAMSEQLAGRHSEPGADLCRLYQRWSASGAGLLITGNVMVDPEGTSEPGQVVLCDDQHLDAFGRWAQTARSGGAQVWMQINHAGRQVPRSLHRRAVAPSAVGLGPLFAAPRALHTDEIARLVQRHADTAALAVRAGFDGVQIHAAHGYLASQFLSPLSNLRQDAYGGTPERRRRFLLEVIEAVRGAVGPRVAVSVKLNSADFARDAALAEEALSHVRSLDQAPIDLLEISGGDFRSAAMLGVADRGSEGAAMSPREGYFLEFARRARQVTRRPLMLTGGFRRARTMEAALASGAVDVIGLARPLVFEPELPSRLLQTPASARAASALGPWPRTPRATGLYGGLREVAWHTVRIWRLARGGAADSDLSPLWAGLLYLGRQWWQQRRLSPRRRAR